jgi:hypothetical protein
MSFVIVRPHEMVGSLDALTRFCRKPNQRRAIGAACPEFIVTRWLYDHRILSFVLHHAEVIDGLPGNHPTDGNIIGFGYLNGYARYAQKVGVESKISSLLNTQIVSPGSEIIRSRTSGRAIRTIRKL